MSALRFVLRAAPPTRLDLSPLIPERLAGLGSGAIERIELGNRRHDIRVGDVFGVLAGDPDQVAIEGGSARFDFVGAGMRRGSLVLEGEAGHCAGRKLAGGRLEIRGDAGGWAASGLMAGHVEITGNAGQMLGGPLAGERVGMAGGILIVRGTAGERAGDRMRRGLLVIEGSAGDWVASRMLAGTIVVCGQAGALPGYLMRRGTLLLGQAVPPATFVPAGAAPAVFGRLLVGGLAAISDRAAQLARQDAERFLGDTATLGKGEILIGAPPQARH